MAASAETLDFEKLNLTNEWTTVLPRRGKQKRNFQKIVPSKQEEPSQSWTPIDTDTNHERESKLLQKMEMYIKKLDNSLFWRSFMSQMQTPELSDRFVKVLGTEEANMKMVMYGIGSIESFEPPRLQLSLAILMKRNFTWIGDIEVFDPIISLTESKVLATLGCSVLSVNEQGKREAIKPTLFFMPHCEAELYDNLLKTNWKKDTLNRIALFGNSFDEYEQYVSIRKSSTIADSRKHIMAIRKFTKEFRINTDSVDFFRAFHGSSWHFFSLDSNSDLDHLVV